MDEFKRVIDHDIWDMWPDFSLHPYALTDEEKEAIDEYILRDSGLTKEIHSKWIIDTEDAFKIYMENITGSHQWLKINPFLYGKSLKDLIPMTVVVPPWLEEEKENE